ncbi:MAG: Ribonuclease HII [Candidatus Amesbacteria bacterium GW2011_GWC2_45_19]|uniref:Ribonuclease n=1 Tax=Candidatus Amesbacteria bacterium GW2011_GWC2_45_19 TaxID=1618366 RepID=A0A0G1PB13_9BACT|nr:MAG: Ribonuclease HII [Candidatus Amesbacteria bacterium GW2011_GWC2_45_19]
MIICGMDEVGRGALAGPLVAAATILNAQRSTLKLNDSKKLTAKQRLKIYGKIKRSGAVIAVEEISARQINTRGMGWANKEVFRRLKNKIPADKYIADGNLKIAGITSVVKADTKIPEVMAASIVAKVFRDRIMDYWQSNKGYGTKYHISAIREHGVTKYHRSKFVRTALKPHP